jgi:dipeptidyl aminopeptidase/acylaminoacyl peptidase
VFVRRQGDGADLARARLADGAVRGLWRTPERDESWPTWSERARRLAFQVGRGRAGERSDLWTWQQGEAEPSPLWETPRRDEGWPAWSPSAAELAFAFRAGARPASVAIVRFGAGAPVAVSVASAAPREWFLRPRFAPDGASLVAQRRAARDSQLWILARDREPRALTDDPAWFHLKAAFTRDGARVVFTRRPAAGGPCDVASVDLRGSDLRLHASAPGSDDQSGTPSPTRDELALVSDRDGNFELYLAPLPEGPARRLTDTPDWNEGAPHWSPDGELLVVTAAPRGGPAPGPHGPGALQGSQIRVIDRSGRQIFEAPGLMPDWMPPW